MQSNLPPQVTVQNIRRIELGMTRQQVEEILGHPISVESKPPAFYGRGAEVLIYFRRLSLPFSYPMLWVHLRDGKVEEVYAKRHNLVDSDGVYGLSARMRWESPQLSTTFPSGMVSGR